GQAGVASSDFLDYLPARDAAELVRNYRPIFRGLWRRIERHPGFRTPLVRNGFDLADVPRPFLRDTVTRRLPVPLLAHSAALPSSRRRRPPSARPRSLRPRWRSPAPAGTPSGPWRWPRGFAGSPAYFSRGPCCSAAIRRIASIWANASS